MAAVHTLFLLIYLFLLLPGSSTSGYYGCKYSADVCDDDERCVDDDWFGQCWSPFSSDEPPSDVLLTDEQLDRLNRLLLSLITHGFGWNDLYSQCTVKKAFEADDDTEDIEIVQYCQEATMAELNNEVALLEDLIDEEVDELSQKEQEIDNGALWSKRDEFVSRHKYKAPWDETLLKTLSQLQRSGDDDEDDEDDGEEGTVVAGDNEIGRYYGGLDDGEDDEEDGSELVANDSDDDYDDEDDDGEPALTRQQLERLLSLLNSAEEEAEEEEEEAEVSDFDSGVEDEDEEQEDEDEDEIRASIILKSLLADDADGEEEGGADDERDEGIFVDEDEDEIDDVIHHLSTEELNSLVNALEEDLTDADATDDDDDAADEGAGLGRSEEDEDGSLMGDAMPLFAEKKKDDSERVMVRVASPATEERGPDPAIALGVNDNRARSDQELSREIESSQREMNDIEKGWLGAAAKDKHYEVVRTDDVTITVEHSFADLDAAEQFVADVEGIVGLAPGTLTDVAFNHGHVTFRVRPSGSQRLNASLVRDLIDLAKQRVLEDTGRQIVGVELADKEMLDGAVTATLNRDGDQLDHSIVVTLSVCGAILGTLLAVLAIFITRRQIERRRKLNEICSAVTTDVEEGKATTASSYQDLCRTRMSVKPADTTAVSESPSSGKQRFFSGTSDSPSSARSSTSSWSEEPVAQSNMDISTGHIILSYMEDHIKNKDRLDEEWSALAQYEPDNVTTLVAQSEANVRKNRYSDMLPYDHSRVKLNAEVNQHLSDFINASLIADNDPRHPAYVATQGPQPHTVADFWQMVWELGSVSIVNLSKLLDRGISYCHQYWPREGTEVYHIYEVNLVSEHIWCEDFLVRSFFLKNLSTNETRTVTQFHYLTWPENGVPALTKAVLEFRRKVKKSFKGTACPTIVHCSDGVGRTGTYILLDMVLNKIARGGKEIDIAATLEYIRDQRPNMLKTKEQFDFVFAAVAEEVQAILKTIPQ